jgi:hypothetical protein
VCGGGGGGGGAYTHEIQGLHTYRHVVCPFAWSRRSGIVAVCALQLRKARGNRWPGAYSRELAFQGARFALLLWLDSLVSLYSAFGFQPWRGFSPHYLIPLCPVARSVHDTAQEACELCCWVTVTRSRSARTFLSPLLLLCSASNFVNADKFGSLRAQNCVAWRLNAQQGFAARAHCR